MIGPPVRRASRRGGEWLWHEVQGYLFLGYLRNRAAGRWLGTLANLPVFLWVSGMPGLGLRQAQRSLAFWARVGKPAWEGKDPRSRRESVIKAMAEELADPQAPVQAKRELKRQIRLLAEGLALLSADPAKGFVDALAAVRIEPREDVYRLATNEHLWIRFQGIAAPYLGPLTSTRPDAQEFWRWGKRYMLDDLELGHPKIARASWTKVTCWNASQLKALSHGAEGTCPALLSVFGVGLAILAGGGWRSGWIRPPELEGIQLPVERSDLGPLMRLIDQMPKPWSEGEP